jgi:hypothetical protein
MDLGDAPGAFILRGEGFRRHTLTGSIAMNLLMNRE